MRLSDKAAISGALAFDVHKRVSSESRAIGWTRGSKILACGASRAGRRQKEGSAAYPRGRVSPGACA